VSNHYHLVLHIDEQENQLLSDEQACQRWGYLYSIPSLVDRWLKQQTVSAAENKAVLNIINGWSGRILREDKKGAIPSQHPKLLNALGLDSESWLS